MANNVRRLCVVAMEKPLPPAWGKPASGSIDVVQSGQSLKGWFPRDFLAQDSSRVRRSRPELGSPASKRDFTRDLFSKVKTGVARSGISLSEPEAAGHQLLDIGVRRARRGSALGGGVLAQ